MTGSPFLDPVLPFHRLYLHLQAPFLCLIQSFFRHDRALPSPVS